MTRILGADPEGKVSLLLDYAAQPRDIADPWYTGNFDVTYEDVWRAAKLFLHIFRRRQKRKEVIICRFSVFISVRRAARRR